MSGKKELRQLRALAKRLQAERDELIEKVQTLEQQVDDAGVQEQLEAEPRTVEGLREELRQAHSEAELAQLRAVAAERPKWEEKEARWMKREQDWEAREEVLRAELKTAEQRLKELTAQKDLHSDRGQGLSDSVEEGSTEPSSGTPASTTAEEEAAGSPRSAWPTRPPYLQH